MSVFESWNKIKFTTRITFLDWAFVFAIMILLLIVYIPKQIWNQEQIDRYESRFRMRSIPPARPEGGGVCVLADHHLLFPFPTRKGPPPGVHAGVPPRPRGFLGNRMVPQVEGLVYIRAPRLLSASGAWPAETSVDPGKSRVITERVL